MKSNGANFANTFRRNLVIRYDFKIYAKSLSSRNLNNLCATKIQTMRARLAKKFGKGLAGKNEITTVKQMRERSGLKKVKTAISKAHTSMVALARRNALWYVGLHKCSSA